MKILITGGAGFIGSHLIECLQKNGDTVVVLDNLSSGMTDNVPSGVKLYERDVCEPLDDIFKAEQFEAVVHLAGQTMVNVSIEQPALDMAINIAGTINVLECCRKFGAKRLVFASTAAVYGDNAALPLGETEQPSPLSFYGLSKCAVESYLRLYYRYYGLEYAVLRFANVYGERQGDGGEGGVISIFTKRIAAGLPITINGDGHQTRDFIYAGDVAKAIWAALTVSAEQVNDVFNVSTNKETSLHDVLNVLRLVSGKDIEPKYGAARAGDIYRSILSNDKAQQKLKWQPQIDFAEGLKRTYEYFCSRG